MVAAAAAVVVDIRLSDRRIVVDICAIADMGRHGIVVANKPVGDGLLDSVSVLAIEIVDCFF